MEIITSYEANELSYYICMYLKYPDPIVLVDLSSSNLSINDIDSTSEACLNNITHEQIVKLAVQLALISINNNQQ